MSPRARRILRRILLPPALLVFLVLWNQYVLARRTEPEAGVFKKVAAPDMRPVGDVREVRLMAYNIAKAFCFEGGRFASKDLVKSRLDLMADSIKAADPDVIFLSEVVWETPWNSVNQLKYLAEKCGYRHYAFGEYCNVGIPFFRYAGGVAVLSKWPLTPVANLDLVGRKPWWVTRNNRRALLVDIAIGTRTVRASPLHLDSFDLENNAAQIRQLLDYLGDTDAILAGDFNCWPGTPNLKLFAESRRFSGSLDGAKTIPSDRPDRRLDFILAPSHWKQTSTRVTGGTASDHLAVVSDFQLP